MSTMEPRGSNPTENAMHAEGLCLLRATPGLFRPTLRLLKILERDQRMGTAAERLSQAIHQAS